MGKSLGESYSLQIVRGGHKSGCVLFFTNCTVRGGHKSEGVLFITNCKRWAQVWVSPILYQLSEVGTSLGDSYSLPIVRGGHKSG